jgi:L-fuconolactonase
MIIDAHQHFWQTATSHQPWRRPEHHALARDFTPSDLRPHLTHLGIDSTVVVQSDDTPAENDRLGNLCQLPFVRGIVGWLPLTDPDAARHEWRRLAITRLAGIRCQLGTEPATWLDSSAVASLLNDVAAANLTWDVVPLSRDHCTRIATTARQLPQLRIVIDHLARAPLAPGADLDAWHSRLDILAACPNIAIKYSIGLNVLTDWAWTPDPLQDCLTAVLDRFGAERTMIASNWPVCELRAPYDIVWTGQLEALAATTATPEDHQQVLGGTASHWYQLDRWQP